MNTGFVLLGRRKARVGLAVCLIALAALVLSAGPAPAAAVNNQQAVPVASSPFDLGGFTILAPILLPAPLPIILTDLTFTASAKWSGAITTSVGWDSDNV